MPGAKLIVAQPSAAPAQGSSDSRLVLDAMRARKEQQQKESQFRTKGEAIKPGCTSLTLLISAMRELDELKKASVFQYTLIRVQFPDKVQ